MTILPIHRKTTHGLWSSWLEAPEFGHMILIINSETGKKLSKRDTNTLQFIEDYRAKKVIFQKQFLTSLLFLVGLGRRRNPFSWSTIKLLMKNRLSKSPAAFDQEEIDWMSNDYIKNADFR